MKDGLMELVDLVYRLIEMQARVMIGDPDFCMEEGDMGGIPNEGLKMTFWS